MRKTLKKYFIPHLENNYHPHILHTKRAIMYGGLFVVMKIIVLVFVVLLPLEVFVMPDLLAEEQRQIIILTNQIRVQNGLPKLTEKKTLDRSSDAKAVDMATNEYFDHTGPHNRSLSYFLDKVGYRFLSAGENLAMGFSSAQEIVDAWVKSPTHYANLVDPEFKDFGVSLEGGYYQGVPTVYAAQHLGLADLPVKVNNEIKIKKSIVVSEVDAKTSGAGVQQVAGLNIQVVTSSEPTSSMAGVIKLGGPTPVGKYVKAKESLGFLTNIFDISKNIYLAFIVFFSLALSLKIFIEIKKQHPRIILQTIGLIGLLVCFYLI
ncbi:MAG: CAP domain-containing protein [Candidatus Magasanikbacteria bacterium]